ncbi:MAG: hypothetical protein QM503_04725 [Bacteroidota bacterium]
MLNKKPAINNNDNFEQIINDIETFGPGIEAAILFLLTDDRITEYKTLLEEYSIELAKGKLLKELPDSERWLIVQQKLIYLLRIIINAR